MRSTTRLVLFSIAILFSFNTVAQDRTGGLALYTVRDAMQTNAKATLQTVADAGYKNVEAAGYADGKYYKMDPLAFRVYLKTVGLNPVSTHQSSITLDNADQQIAAAKEAGFTYFVVPIPPMGMFTFNQETRTMGMEGSVQDLADILNTLGEKCAKAGLQLLYHNHDFELKPNQDGIVPLDYLLENCDPKYVNFQMDLFWMTKANADPVAYFNKYPGRFKAWHVKDMDSQGRFAPVGQGSIDFARILEHKETAGMEHYFVEQDMTFDGLDPLEAIKISHDAILKLGFN